MNSSDRNNALFGFKQGKELGDYLKELMDVVLERPEMNTRDILLGLAHDKISLLS